MQIRADQGLRLTGSLHKTPFGFEGLVVVEGFCACQARHIPHDIACGILKNKKGDKGRRQSSSKSKNHCSSKGKGRRQSSSKGKNHCSSKGKSKDREHKKKDFYVNSKKILIHQDTCICSQWRLTGSISVKKSWYIIYQ